MNEKVISHNEWIRKRDYDTLKMIKTMREENIEDIETYPDEKYRFYWRESLVMVKNTYNVQINTITESQMEYIEGFRKEIPKTEQKKLF